MSKRRFVTRLSAERIALHEAAGEWPIPGPTALLEARLRTAPERIFAVDGDDRVSFRDLAERAGRLAAALRSLGLGEGDVVSWQLPSWIEAAVLTVALDAIGAISNPILPIYRESEVGFILRQARSRALVVPGVFRGFDHRELARGLWPGAPDLEHVIVARGEPGARMLALEELVARVDESPLPASPFGPHDVATIFYTSGTTADPKGVLHTQSTLGYYARTNARSIGTQPDDVGLLQFPLSHLGGVGSFVTLPLLVGSSGVYLDVWDPERAMALIERERVTSAGGPPAILQGILRAPGFRPERLATVRGAATGAADVPPELIRELRRTLGAASFRSYGMTECPMFASGRADDPEEKCMYTDGRVVAGGRCRIVDEQDRAVATGEEGEILAFGPQLCVGYLDASLNDAAFTADGYFRSGDLGVLDADGYLRVSGRKKDIIIRKGENLSAKAIEDVLHEHPAIAEAAVIGVSDRDRGELVCACVVLRDPKATLGLGELAEFMSKRGAMRQKIPERIELLAELPRNATGKVQKHELRSRFGG